VNITPRQVTVSAKSMGSPSRLKGMSPMTLSVKPVAVTMMSAASSSPDFSRTPPLVNRSISSVTTEASPRLMAWNRSASGTKAMRWRQGL